MESNLVSARFVRYLQAIRFFGLEGTDNAIAITSDRYATQPLVIQGAGAGAELTASGVLADVQWIGQSLSLHTSNSSSWIEK
jgi:homoserine dehydrogenase